MRGANAKFERRFAHIETGLAERGQTPEGASLDEMERLWAEAKAKERPEGRRERSGGAQPEIAAAGRRPPVGGRNRLTG